MPIVVNPAGVTAANLSFQEGTVSISGGPLTLSATSTMSVATGLSATIASVIGGATTAIGVTKTGAGTLVLTGANTYTGTTTISGGSLRLAGGSAIADSSAVSLINTAQCHRPL